MAGPARILKAGLTGGIASGKTTVAGFLRELGAFIVDADELARLVMAPGGSAYDEVVERFGREILDPWGEIDRPGMAERVFGDSSVRHALNAIVHPRVRAEAEKRMARCAEEGRWRVAVFDAALLVETGYYHEMDRLIVLRCSPETQRRRLEMRNGMTAADAEARLATQASLDRKLGLADYVIDTDVPLDETRRQTERVYEKLLRDHEVRFGTGRTC